MTEREIDRKTTTDLTVTKPLLETEKIKANKLRAELFEYSISEEDRTRHHCSTKMTTPSSRRQPSPRRLNHHEPSSQIRVLLMMKIMTIILLLKQCVTVIFLLHRSGSNKVHFVAGFTIVNKQSFLMRSPYYYSSIININNGRVHKTHLWYIGRRSDSKNKDTEEDFEHQEMSSTPPSPSLLKASDEPSKDKPSKKFISPIQLLKRVPKVEPINKSSVFFVKPTTTLWSTTSFPGAGPASTAAAAGETAKNNIISETKSTPTSNTIGTWKDKMKSQQSRSTAFQATNYLESLGGTADNSSTDNKNSDNDDNISYQHQQQKQQQQQDELENNTNDDALYKNLKAQQGNLRNEQQKSMQEAIYNAMRRTNPNDVIQARFEKLEKERKAKERERLEREYVERKERLDAKKRKDDAELLEKGSKKEMGNKSKAHRNRGLPILGPFIKSPSPLLIGRTLTFQYSDLTPFQKKALEVSQHYHEEHCTRMKDENEHRAGDEGGIQAAPIVAIIDSFTRSAFDKEKKNKRFATLSSVEMEQSRDGTRPARVKLTGIGRVFLYDYFSSKDAGITQEEEDLENILKLIQEVDTEDDETEDNQHEEGDDDDDLPVVIASFSVILDDSSILSNQSRRRKHDDATELRSSSMHAITELYRTANRVYRLHEDRKKIVAGLKAAEARMLLGNEMMNENCDIEYEDCDGLGFLLGGVDFLSKGFENTLLLKRGANLSPLAQMENYGFGSFGILSTIPDLTKELMLYLEPYYSPSHREREEYEAEVASFVAWRCLEEYANPSDIAAAMMTSSATDRLNMAYDIMMRHKEELNALVKMISDDLFDCGDNCEGLW